GGSSHPSMTPVIACGNHAEPRSLRWASTGAVHEFPSKDGSLLGPSAAFQASHRSAKARPRAVGDRASARIRITEKVGGAPHYYDFNLICLNCSCADLDRSCSKRSRFRGIEEQ